MLIVATIAAYFLLVYAIGRVVSRDSGNESFYMAGRKSPWWLVAFGMVGASISGVSFVSVPGMVLGSGMSYLETCLGFMLGYFLVAFILLPVYYRMDLATIYKYLERRLGRRSYKTGAAFFLLSDLAGSSVKFHVVCMLLQRYVLDAMGIPFWVTVPVLVMLIWLYTRDGGVRTLVFTDTFQTSCMLAALALIIARVVGALGLDVAGACRLVASSDLSRIFVLGDWASPWNFFKQFTSGAFIVIVMTGLNQNMMQKNLTCKTLREARKDMCAYGLAFFPVNMLLLALGVLLVALAGKDGVPLPANPDELVPMFTATGVLGYPALALFVVAVTAASLSTADSSLTALTTTFCLDIVERPADERLRRRVHLAMAVAMVAFISLFRIANSTSMIDAIYIMCSYTYGPLLGLFAFGLLTGRKVDDRAVPYVAVASPVLCFLLEAALGAWLGYRFGYELLLLNGLLTFLGLWAFPSGRAHAA